MVAKKKARAPRAKAEKKTETRFYEPTRWQTVQTPWWSQSIEEDAKWSRLFEFYQAMRLTQAGRYAMMRRFASVLEYGYRVNPSATTRNRDNDDATLMSGNRAFHTIRTILADVLSQATTIQVYTEGGSFEERELAEDATQALQAVLDAQKYRLLEEDVLTDALAVSGTGILTAAPNYRDGTVELERKIPYDVMFADEETRAGKPRTITYRHMVDRGQAAAYFDVDLDGVKGTYDERLTSISDATSSVNIDEAFDPPLAGQLEMLESIHLPAAYREGDDEECEASADGMRLVAINGMTLYCEQWKHRHFNAAFLTPIRPRTGFWGVPLMRFLAPVQRELEALDIRLQRAHRLMGQVLIAIPEKAEINVRQIANESGKMFVYSGDVGPTTVSMQPVHEQVYAYRETLQSEMLRFVGQSQMAATGNLPSGLTHTSGRAISMALDTGSRINAYILRAREAFLVDVCDRILDAVEDLLEVDPDAAARFVQPGGYRVIPWKKIIEARERLVLRTAPINALSTHPTTKLSQATELLVAKAIDVEEWRELSGVDLKAKNDLDTAPRKLIMKLLDVMVRDGNYRDPEDFYDLQECVELGVKMYCLVQIQQPKNRRALDNIRRWIADSSARLDEQIKQMAAQQQMMMGPQQQQGAPEQTPPPAEGMM